MLTQYVLTIVIFNELVNFFLNFSVLTSNLAYLVNMDNITHVNKNSLGSSIMVESLKCF